MRAPGMTLMRMPVFIWMTLVVQFLLVLAFPAITVALILLMFDRFFGTLFYSPAAGGDPLLWQHLFWIFGHPEVYILILPAMGIVSEVLPDLLAQAALRRARRHLLRDHDRLLRLRRVEPPHVLDGHGPGGRRRLLHRHHAHRRAHRREDLQLDRHAVGRQHPLHDARCCFSLGFIAMFTMGGLSGVMHASPPVDLQQTDTYFVVAHFHYVLFGGSIFGIFSGIYYWWPKMYGRLLDERLGQGALLADDASAST